MNGLGHIVTTIVPIFTLVAVGWLAHRKGFLPEAFMGPANRLVYYLAIPAMIFRAVAGASLSQQFNPLVLAITLAAVIAMFAICWFTAPALKIPSAMRASFIQCTFHGNLGYIGLAVAFYYLGTNGLARASILAAFLMILQNLLSVLVLQSHRPNNRSGGRLIPLAMKIAGNPVILAAASAIVVATAGIRLPLVVDRSLQILSGLALPMALLIIGGSLSVDRMRQCMAPVTGTCLFKLLALPALGLALFRLADVPSADYVPAMILLASPTATIAYVMAREMDGDADFAVAAISATTLFSAITFIFWLGVG